MHISVILKQPCHKAKINEPLELSISDKVNSLTVQGNVVEQSINSPMSVERIKTQVEKLGETPYKSLNTIIEADENIFISIKELNNLRRNIVNDLSNLRMNSNQDIIIKELNFSFHPLIFLYYVQYKY